MNPIHEWIHKSMECKTSSCEWYKMQIVFKLIVQNNEIHEATTTNYFVNLLDKMYEILCYKRHETESKEANTNTNENLFENEPN